MLLLGTFLSPSISYATDAPQKACRTKVSTIKKLGSLVKNSGCVIFKFDKDNRPTHVLMYRDDIDDDKKVDGYSLPGGKRAAIKYDRASIKVNADTEGDQKFSKLSDTFGVEYSESAIQTACRETREETKRKMSDNSDGLEIIVVDLLNPDDKYFFAFTCLAPDIDKLIVSQGIEKGDYSWVSKEDAQDENISFNYTNRDIVIKALEVGIKK